MQPVVDDVAWHDEVASWLGGRVCSVLTDWRWDGLLDHADWVRCSSGGNKGKLKLIWGRFPSLDPAGVKVGEDREKGNAG